MSKTENSAPNIVLIVTDQQRWDTLGCLGYDHVITPHIDRLAARGVAFSRAFVQGAVCGPSRNSIVSGQYVHTHGIDRNEAWLTPEQPNWIEQLRDGGYHTVNIGKMHTAPIRLPCGFRHRTVVENKNYRQGHHGPDPDDYDLYLMQFGLRRPALTYYRDVPNWPDYLGAAVWPHDEDLFIDNCVGRWSVEAIRTHDFAVPLFLWSGFAGPHDPFDAPASALARYEGVDIPDPVGIPNELDTKPPPQRRAMEGMDGKHAPAAIWWSRATPERIRRMRRHYYANITAIDDWVGAMVAAMDERGELDNTVFVFTSDHGDCLGDHHQVYKFSSHYDSVARVPLVFAGPGVERLGVRDPLVELIDLGPTLLEMAGLEPLAGAAGLSLEPLLRGKEAVLHETVFSEYGPRIMARTEAWKLVFYPGEPYGELYHLEEDPDELYNLYDDLAHAGARGEMVERMMDWYGKTRMQR
ncbi:MAG: sulfatase-like hydrolase/transferase [Gemmatimonadota bacterium]|nr:sulfatase-like hydrolase/transferase [Gemmatimonadota bacterium]